MRPLPVAVAVAAVHNPSARWSGAPLKTWLDLATAMATSGTYTLVPGFSMNGYGGWMGVQKGVNVTVLGQGAVLDASSKGHFFWIHSGASLTLKDLTLQHGSNVVSGWTPQRACRTRIRSAGEHPHGAAAGGSDLLWVRSLVDACAGVVCACRIMAEPWSMTGRSRPAAATLSATER